MIDKDAEKAPGGFHFEPPTGDIKPPLTELEDLASSFKGVGESYAIQAGREVRIVVKPEEIDDLSAIQLSKEIAAKIEETMQYPGQIKVTVIRETRSADYAK